MKQNQRLWVCSRADRLITAAQSRLPRRLKRRRAPLKERRRNARSKQKFPFVGTSFWSSILFVGLCASSPNNFSADANTMNADKTSVCHSLCMGFTPRWLGVSKEKSHRNHTRRPFFEALGPRNLTRSFTLKDIDGDFAANRCVRGQRIERVSPVPRVQVR